MVSNGFPRPYRGRRCGTNGAAKRYLDVGRGVIEDNFEPTVGKDFLMNQNPNQNPGQQQQGNQPGQQPKPGQQQQGGGQKPGQPQQQTPKSPDQGGRQGQNR